MNKTERVGTLIFGALLVALGLFIGVETMGMSAGPAYVAVGPRAFPSIIGLGLILVGSLQLVAAKTARTGGHESERYDWRALAGIAGSFALPVFVLPWLGWVPTAVILFVGVSRAFGERRFLRTVGIGLSLAVATFLLFGHVLGLDLPIGSLVADVLGLDR